MGKPKLILDFDGTLTDVRETFPIYESRFREIFSSMTGVSVEDLRGYEERIGEAVRRDPLSGWVNGGLVVASAQADPYAFNATVYQAVCGELGISEERRDEILSRCYRGAYSITPTKLKEGLDGFLAEVQKRYDVNVVTNSSGEHVSRELAKVGFPEHLVVGGAQKHIIDENWNGVPFAIDRDGFPRPVMLRKRAYGEILKGIGGTPLETTVVGDIYELDLALPDYLGMGIVQMVGASTPVHEIDYVRNHARGEVVRNLEEARDVLL